MPLHVAFLWHMHQPHYVDSVRGVALMPWVRLHATKGYLDMLWMVEQHPEFRCTFNLTPVLLQQIEQLARREVRDVWHELARTPAGELTPEQQRDLLEHFFKANWPNMVRPHHRYWALLQKRGQNIVSAPLDQIARQFTTQEYRDLQVWFNLTWFGYAAQRFYPEIAELKRKGENFSEDDKQLVFERQQDILDNIIGWYRKAADRGQIEISTTPFFHPILPLVLNTEYARRCLPGKELPPPFAQPEDARAQLALARAYHENLFGQPPTGLWPSEGSVCPELVPILHDLGFEWFATDEEILWRSLAAGQHGHQHHVERHTLYQPFRAEFGSDRVGIAFRDRELSDFIGFSAARNEPAHAAKFITDKLGEIRRSASRHGHDPFCAVILDGENAWENFADGGEAFLNALYGSLARHPELKPTTFRDHFRHHAPKTTIQSLHTGSWINADFKIWIGHPEDNRGWELLGQTRRFLQDQNLNPEQLQRARQEIYAAEGSDWFWWYGDDFVTDNDRIFDDLFRTHLQNVYRITGAQPPDSLKQPICQLQPIHEIRPPTDLLAPTIDGAITSYYEWVGAGEYVAGRAMGTMFQTERLVDGMHFGTDLERFYLRVDFRPGSVLPDAAQLQVTFLEPRHVAASFVLRRGRPATGSIVPLAGGEPTEAADLAPGGFGQVLEVAVPFKALGWQTGNRVSFFVQVMTGQVELERHPVASSISLVIADEQFGVENWRV